MRIYAYWEIETDNARILDIWTLYMMDWTRFMPDHVKENLGITSLKLLACGKETPPTWTN